MTKGFKDEIGKKKEVNKRNKKIAKSKREKRQRKIDDLNSRPKSWQGLESRDIRTPSTYFSEKDDVLQSPEEIKARLNDLLQQLEMLKSFGDGTPAKEILLKKEIEKTEATIEKIASHDRVLKIVGNIQDGNNEEAVQSMYTEVEYKLLKRMEPYLKLAGKEIEEHIFSSK